MKDFYVKLKPILSLLSGGGGGSGFISGGVAEPFSASGGNAETTEGGDKIHIFTSPGNFNDHNKDPSTMLIHVMQPSAVLLLVVGYFASFSSFSFPR